MPFRIEPSSFRDPSGFIFYHNGTPYRQINNIAEYDFKLLCESGLYNELVSKEYLISHEKCDVSPPQKEVAFTVIKPEIVPFISYPYEWSFSQLKDAALLTLKIQQMALKYGMSLKDASAYNIQFLRGKPVHIDTLSFEKYPKGQPWHAYRQFCQHFLSPLSLMAYKQVELGHLLKTFIDGIPLNVASSLLPFWAIFKPSLFVHIYLHSRVQKRFQDNELVEKPVKEGKTHLREVSIIGIQGIVESLESAVKKCRWKIKKSVWRDYYKETNYADDSFQAKKEIVVKLLKLTNPNTVWDLGANTGIFSKLATNLGIKTISVDVDMAAVELNYIQSQERGDQNMLPLVLDVVNPSGGIGWENRERKKFFERGNPDVVMALALIHHLAIGNNIPLEKLAAFFTHFAPRIIIEFIPKSDSQVKRLLQYREDIFPEYTIQNFEEMFGKLFSIEKRIDITNSERTLYLLRRGVDVSNGVFELI